MSPDDARHGTTRGHAAGCRELCCREARNADEARRRKYRQVLGITRSVNATGTRRRIRALMALGWRGSDIAAHCGWSSAQAVTEVMGRRFVYTGTAALIAAAYEDMSMQQGPSDKNRRQAATKGWAPPLCWDDDTIDDPAAHPTGIPTPTRKEAAELTVADWELLQRNGYTRRAAAEYMGISKKRLEKAIERASRRLAEAS